MPGEKSRDPRRHGVSPLDAQRPTFGEIVLHVDDEQGSVHGQLLTRSVPEQAGEASLLRFKSTQVAEMGDVIHSPDHPFESASPHV
ncbi:hypothetical protein GCM10009563_24230 [Subtercola frigoramans]